MFVKELTEVKYKFYLSPTISNFGGQENWGGTEEVGNSNRLKIRTQHAEIQ